MSQQTTQQAGNITRVIDAKYALVCADVLIGIPAKASCRTHGLNYNTFNKRRGFKPVATLRNENGVVPTTDTTPQNSPSPEGSDDSAHKSVHESSPDQQLEEK